MLIGLYLILLFFYFDIIISYHIQLYFFTLFLFCFKIFKTNNKSPLVFFIFFIFIFWGFSINLTYLNFDNYLNYFFIINGCLYS